MYDLIIKGGRVIDPAQNIDNKLDIAVKKGKIALVAEDISLTESRQVINAQEKIVTPGLIDLHCHVGGSLVKTCVDPDTAGVSQGVTTVVDGGSTGEATFGGFSKYVIPSSLTTVFCFLYLGSQGIYLIPGLNDWDEINLDAIADTIESNRDVIKGIKLCLAGNIVASTGIKLVEIAKKTTKKFGLPIMVHIGDMKQQVPPTLTQELLLSMESGDILTHVFTPKFGSPLRADGTIMPELKDAMERGVVLDVAPGWSNFSFEVAKESLAQGILPTTLSTDLSTLSLNGPAYGLTVTMSKFMALGLNLKQVIEMTTINPARVLGAENKIGSLKPGMEADISILVLQSVNWDVEDYGQNTAGANKLIAPNTTMRVTKLISPNMTVKSGKQLPAQLVIQPKPIGLKV